MRTRILVAAFVAAMCVNLFAEGSGQTLTATYDKGLGYLLKQQNADGSWNDPAGNPDVAFTSMAIASVAGSPADVLEKNAAAIDKAVAYILAQQQPDGGFYHPLSFPTMMNYKTAISLMALAELDAEKYKDAIAKGRDFLVGLQLGENYGEVKPGDWPYGGWGYEKMGKDGKTPTDPQSDMSNASLSLEALKAAGVPEDSEVWKRAVAFLNRCQNRSESNDMAKELVEKGIVVGNDGGFTYRPHESKAGEEELPEGKKGLRSYGSMTYAGLKSFIYANVKKDDPRVQAAYGWIQKHYTLDQNPELGEQGLYYYYHTFAKAMDAYGEGTITDAAGEKHAWAEELVEKLASLQQEDGSWANGKDRWYEGHGPLVTSYCLRALNACRKWQPSR